MQGGELLIQSLPGNGGSVAAQVGQFTLQPLPLLGDQFSGIAIRQLHGLEKPSQLVFGLEALGAGCGQGLAAAGADLQLHARAHLQPAGLHQPGFAAIQQRFAIKQHRLIGPEQRHRGRHRLTAGPGFPQATLRLAQFLQSLGGDRR